MSQEWPESEYEKIRFLYASELAIEQAAGKVIVGMFVYHPFSMIQRIRLLYLTGIRDIVSHGRAFFDCGPSGKVSNSNIIFMKDEFRQTVIGDTEWTAGVPYSGSYSETCFMCSQETIAMLSAS